MSKTAGTSSLFRLLLVVLAGKSLVDLLLTLIGGSSKGVVVFENHPFNNNNKDAPLLMSERNGWEDSGWHDIHVFVGKPANLTAIYKDASSQEGQDNVIIALLNKMTSGFFLDLAANHAVDYSNTFRLERDFSWNGLCIEPNPTYWEPLSHRRCTVVAAVVGEERLEAVNFVVPEGHRAPSGGIEGEDFDNQPNKTRIQGVRKKRYRMYTVPLLEILTRYSVPTVIDYMSLDVEGAEWVVMKGFPFQNYRIRVLTVERPKQELIDMLYENGYVYLAAFNAWGDETLFADKSTFGLLNLTVLETLHRSNTRIMEMPNDLMQECPKRIAKPMGPFVFKKYLKQQALNQTK